MIPVLGSITLSIALGLCLIAFFLSLIGIRKKEAKSKKKLRQKIKKNLATKKKEEQLEGGETTHETLRKKALQDATCK